ncbi:MAG: hypothetical protein GY816_02450 [Cytophagales bacterium]|nr:hypothetical protein [Cytophagales bacterium]
MKHFFRSSQLLILFTFLFTISCQEDSLNKEIDMADEDMIKATELAETYLNSSNARVGWDTEKAITVLKFKDDKLLYATNTDHHIGYREVTEETITAYVDPGEFIFWYSGGGISDLDGIEFDDDSQFLLDGLPEEINVDLMWVIHIPEDIGEDDNINLKYDIIYQFKGNVGLPIKLDPKIKVNQ